MGSRIKNHLNPAKQNAAPTRMANSPMRKPSMVIDPPAMAQAILPPATPRMVVARAHV